MTPSPHFFSTARELAVRHPEASLPCPVCAASVKAENLEKHLGKVHPDATSPTTWRGVDHASFIVGCVASALGFALLAGAVMVSDRAADVVLYPVTALAFVGAGLMLGSLGGMLHATVALEGNTLVLRYALGLLGRRVPLPPERVFVGSMIDSRPTIPGGPYDDINVPHDDVRVGSYLRLTGGGKSLTLGSKTGTGFRKHWDPSGYADGGKKRLWDVILEPSALVAIEYQLASHGLLQPRKP